MISDHASFNGDFNKEHTAAEPAGADLVEFIAAALEQQESSIVSKSRTDYSHSVTAITSGCKFLITVGAVGDENAEWLLFFKLDNPIRRMGKSLHQRQYAMLAKSIHKSLTGCSKISEIRWYQNAANWNFQPDSYRREP